MTLALLQSLQSNKINELVCYSRCYRDCYSSSADELHCSERNSGIVATATYSIGNKNQELTRSVATVAGVAAGRIAELRHDPAI
jgi:hypothetical protein